MMTDPEVKAEIARLTAERDEWIQRADRAEARFAAARVALKWDEGRMASERAAYQANLAAARAALEPLAALPSSDGGYILAGDNVKQSFYVRTGDIRHARDVLSNPGTGEALVAVREAQEAVGVLMRYPNIRSHVGSEIHDGLMDALTHLRAIFGEGEK